MFESKLEIIGEMPAYYKIADFLWGDGANIDSDGNSENPNSTNWTELTLILRSDTEQRIDIDPIDDRDKLLILKATTEELMIKTVSYLKDSGAIK